MSILIFNGEMERRANSTSLQLGSYLKQQLAQKGETVNLLNLGEWNIPIFDVALNETPESVKQLARLFREADYQIWLTPLYHGSMTGAMKNCLDWLEITSKDKPAYLTNKVVGLVCWAGGSHAMQGINAMDSVVKALRAWTLPYSVPAVGCNIFEQGGKISVEYERKFGMMINLLMDAVEFQTNNKQATLI